ncbi:MAG: glycosyl transferase [Treponema sp.]|nr:glycosyl transferase [Treponema sp.]
MIPKTIHYCWFGGNPLPELAQKCIASWKKFLPDYEIKEWNESNYDVRKIPYSAQAYDAKKYAFVSDYARFDILYQYGGVYFDTDVEVIKPMDDILAKGAFIGVEKGLRPLLAAGLGIASPAASPIYREILDSYQNEQFVNDDDSLNLKTVVTRVSDIFKSHGFVEQDIMQFVADTMIYPSEYFCPKNFVTGELRITENTQTIHHYDGSWCSDYEKHISAVTHKIYACFGQNAFSKLLVVVFRIGSKLREYGFAKTVRYYLKGEKL